MTQTTSTLCGCGRPTAGDRFLCGDCSDHYAQALGSVPGLVDDLEVTLAKQARFTDTALVPVHNTGLPYDQAASDSLHRLRAELVSLVRLCVTERVRSSDYRDRWPADTPASMSRWLLWRVDGVAVMAWAADAMTLVEVVAQAELVVDRPPDRVYAGPCDTCRRDLYVDPGQDAVTCERCGIAYDLEARRDWLLDAAYDTLGTATEVARALSSLELPVTPDRVWQWRHRGRLTPKGHNLAHQPLYRVGDVADLLAADLPRTAP
jgi:hypothetical protein